MKPNPASYLECPICAYVTIVKELLNAHMETHKELPNPIDDLAAKVFCMGQDWSRGDGSASLLDGLVAETKQSLLAEVLKVLKSQPTWESSTMIDAEDLVKALTELFGGEV